MNNVSGPLIDAEWKKIQKSADRFPAERPGPFWDSAVSPPFPAQWPRESDRRIIRYLYALCLDPQIMDGVRVAAPWGRIESEGGEDHPPRFVRLSEKIRATGIQGVRPVTKEEMLVYEKGQRAESVLEALAGMPDEHDPGTILLRDYYRTWFVHNGVIANEIFRMHKPFFRWVGYRE